MPLKEANFSVRKFEEGHEAQSRLEMVAKTVVNGYNTTVEHGLNDDLRAISQSISNELSGFFHEGIGMGLYALDLVSLRNKNRFWNYIIEKDKKHEYMSYIGAGLTCGVFNSSYEKLIDKIDPMSGPLVLDGVGFYYAMFKTKKTITNFYVPKKIKSNDFYLERYDNGLGRALWFYNSGEPKKIKNTINTFPKERRANIWSGIGLAAAYAGGISNDKIPKLKSSSGIYQIMLAQGALLAAHTRYTAGNPHKDDITVKLLTGISGLKCHKKALEFKQRFQGEKYIDGKPSFQVFLEHIREWLGQVNLQDVNYEIEESKLVVDIV
ncbi:DUF1702 family protein [Flavivirga jejuensis]